MSPARLATTLAGASALTLTAALVASTGAAWADNPLAPKTSFNMTINPYTGAVTPPADGESVPNIDSVKSTVRAYYNASGGKADKTSSRYITQVHQIENQLLHALPKNHPAGQAVVFDIDDTLLWNYDYEDGGSNFNYDPVSNGQAVANGFPAVPGMPALLQTLNSRGYAIYGITGRPASQESLTVDNLNAQHFTADGSTTPAQGLFNAGNLFTKDPVVVTAGNAAIPTQTWVDCGGDGTVGSCSTVEYKAGTRKHVAGLDTPADPTDDHDIVMNVGDQWSDLMGGFADDFSKIPNPTYFLASPDIAGAPASDATMVPPTSYAMQPDGSSGYTVASGDDIPNVDLARSDIRAYYNATGGVADKGSSNYISQLTSLTSAWTTSVANDCTTKASAYNAATTKQAAAAKAVSKDKKAVKKAKKAIAKAKSPAARNRAHHKLTKATKALKTDKAALAAITIPDKPGVVFDADDTTLWNYDLEDSILKFVYDANTANGWVTGQKFPAVPGMIAVVKAAKAAGCSVFGLTGRPTSQLADTVANLQKDGYLDASGQPLFTTGQFFTKGPVVATGSSASIPTQPWVDCGTDTACSTIEYKSSTRGHIQDLGYDIVGNFGDQYSDLIGGHADHTYKVPNPTYYLP